MIAITYLVYGAIIAGGDEDETVTLCREAKVGDEFYANSSWFRVKSVGLKDLSSNNKFGYVMVAEKCGR